ncbi:hypothetical protein A4D02_26465 [Niastella koreensis]|uniref:Uncharacterized protein n=2 Tax=Niastella koreensis TaxID=354356 RepID=G8TJI4_NIAKG|nr:hypothetical protein [Niastella koreensis]AEV99719.1 hypothetical protein Niako_3414 [Niastella koreensis GR20-10]OQP51655.1 hypothetical protein A4D02_26465 [Niastella koreensis]
MKLKSWYLVLFISMFFIACKKDKPEEKQDNTGPKLTTDILTKAGNAQRTWSLFMMEIKYLSASGSVDSTYTKGPIYNLANDVHNIQFSIGRDMAGQPDAKISTLTTSPNVLDRVFPGIGNWTLSNDGKTLTCTKYTAVPRWATGGDGGTFSVDYKDEVLEPLFPENKALGLKIKQPLPNNRKAEASFIFSSR